MGLLIEKNGKYCNKNAVENVVRYIIRERKNEDRRNELKGYGAFGVSEYLTPEVMIKQMNHVQEVYNIEKRGGRRIRHHYYLFNEMDNRFLSVHPEVAMRIAQECAQIYFNMDHQVVYAVHRDAEGCFHIHFCINAINFMNGLKYNETKRQLFTREKLFDEITRRHITIINPICFSEYDTDYSFFDEFSNCYNYKVGI